MNSYQTQTDPEKNSMYYHEIISMIADALSNSNEAALQDIEHHAADLLLSEGEAQAITNLIEAAYESINR